MAIADTGKAEAQPLSPEAYQAQQAEIARLSQAVQLAEVENQGLRARVAELEALLEMQRGATDAVIADKNRILEMSDAAIDVLEARLASLETPQKPPICLQEPPVVVSGGDSASEYAGMPWEGRP